MKHQNSVLIIGCGDIGQRVAARYLQQGKRVSALARSTDSQLRLQAQGITALVGDLDDPASLRGLSNFDLVYYFAPPPGESTTDPRIENFLTSIQAEQQPAKLVYLSTSGVYGDHTGAWVTEETPPNPQTTRAKARLAAEMALRKWGRHNGTPIVILRVGGIYGPGRLPIERIQQGLPVVRVEECPYTNRIHENDLATVCIAAAERGESDAIYNVSDGNPGTMTDYFNTVADHLGLPRPPQISLADAQKRLSPGILSYLNESRRMDNRRMINELGVTLHYPNLEAGLAASK